MSRPLIFRLALTVACALVLPTTALADGLAVQLALRTQAGGPVPDGSYGLVVTLYDDATPANAVYTQSLAAVPVSGGVASLVLGEGPGAAPLDGLALAGQAAALGVSVDGEPELPKVAVRPVLRAWLADHAKTADTATLATDAVNAQQAVSADSAAFATQALKADTASNAEELACTGCINASHLSPALAEAYLDKAAGGEVTGAITASGGVDMAGSALANAMLTGARLATVDPSGDPCTLADKGRVGISSGGDIWYCSGQLWRRVASCAQVCPDPAAITCGDDVLDDCGDVCAQGTLCPQGASCENSACVYPLGTVNNPAPSCKAILDAGDATGSGLYTLDPDGPNNGELPYEGLCDMDTDGGGWTVFFVGKNGSPHKFAEFESDVVACPDPQTKCLRRVPASVTTATTFAATCGDDAVSFTLGDAALALFKSGSKSQWQPLSNVQALTPDVAQPPDSLWTGQSSNNSWILTKEGAGTFSSSYNENTGWNGCDGTPNTGAPIKLMYR
jgi:hypothetical protein